MKLHNNNIRESTVFFWLRNSWAGDAATSHRPQDNSFLPDRAPHNLSDKFCGQVLGTCEADGSAYSHFCYTFYMWRSALCIVLLLQLPSCSAQVYVPLRCFAKNPCYSLSARSRTYDKFMSLHLVSLKNVTWCKYQLEICRVLYHNSCHQSLWPSDLMWRLCTTLEETLKEDSLSDKWPCDDLLWRFYIRDASS